jgi:hypothetical protein
MPDINIVLHKGKTPFGKKPFEPVTPADDRYGFWGMVTELHPKNHTVHVRTPEGRIISNVRVSSSVWVTIDKDKGFLSGRRYIPPIDTYVLVFMPNGKYSSAVVIASGFSDDPQHAGFKGNKEDKKEIDESILNSGWKFTEDNRTGTRVLQNKPNNPTIVFEVNQDKNGEEYIVATIHENVISLNKQNLKINIGDCLLETNGKQWVFDVKGNKIIHTENKTIISDNLEVSK